MDAETEKLLERTRQRRELLDQKMGKTPQATPRKRRSPLSEDLTSNVETGPTQPEDSPKRQCVREVETSIKGDTPAIKGVKSRLQALSSQRAGWTQGDAENSGDSSPVPISRKTVSPPGEEASKPSMVQENSQPRSQRKSRFAQLASNISSWEDDLSHPTIVKEEEKKPRWQPPKATDTPCDQLSSTKPSQDEETAASNKASKKSEVSSSSDSKSRSNKSPVKSAKKEDPRQADKMTVSSPKKTTQSDAGKEKPITGQDMEVNQTEDSSLPMDTDVQEGNTRSVGENKMQQKCTEAHNETSLTKVEMREKHMALKTEEQRVPQTPKAVIPPSERPLSARLANWEQKISDNVKSDAAGTPKPGLATPGKVVNTPRRERVAGAVLNTPVPADSDAVQMRPKSRRTVEDEPTAHSVLARMSAWEQISSAHEVASIKKVKPGDCTPVKTSHTSPSKQAGQSSTQDDGLAKSASSTPQQVRSTASRSGAVGSGAKVAQWQASQQSQSSDMAQRIRQERMAELQRIQNRWKNGLLKDDKDGKPEEPPKAESSSKSGKRQDNREKARADFETKLASAGLGASGEKKSKNTDKTDSDHQPCKPSSDAAPASTESASKPARPTTLFKIVSQQKESSTPKPSPSANASKACRKVKFDDSFDSPDSHLSPRKKQTSHDDSDPGSKEEEDMEVVLRRPRPAAQQLRPNPEDEDDLSLSAFVPEAVRRESILPSPCHDDQELDSSINSVDSFEAAPGAPPDFHKSTVDLVKLGQQFADSDSCSSLEPSTSHLPPADSHTNTPPSHTAHASSHTALPPHTSPLPSHTAPAPSHADPHPSQSAVPQPRPRTAPSSQDLEESVDDRDAIGDLLDEAMDSEEEEAPVMRKKVNQRKATDAGDLPFSINEYRASRNMQMQEVKQVIVRNSQYAGMAVKEEHVDMPTSTPTPAPRRSVQDRIKELQELVQQEQSVIMQTSNALNQCCSSASYFAGSSQQVECNRILLLSCQKRQAYMTEIQRLKDTGVVDQGGPGPKGSLTISDIRLPLKKDFVTKIGTSQDTMKYYLMLLVRNGPQVICTQMLSTHDPMMRGSLDFPNLIKINGITGAFHLQLDVYSMSVSLEAGGKDKKKKTPKKTKASALTVQSPGGPLAVRMTSFSQVSSVNLTMKSLDKHSFNLDRLSHLSPLHGMIYMKLKCVMEASVEEKGFLTMFEDVSGLGSWHRRWCVLRSNKLQYWKYPDDESKKDPIGYLDLKRCVTEKVGLISRDVCARPHTFELVVVRQPMKGEKDTLVSRTYNTTTTVRHMLSADTKEERIVWCNKLNRALANLRTWHSDAMTPSHK